MASEITITTALSAKKGTVQNSQSLSAKADQANAGGVNRQQSIPTADTVLTLTGVVTPGWIQIKNTDPTNFVKLGPTSGGAIVPAIRLKPAMQCTFFIEPGVVWRAIADTAACILESLILET